MTAKRTGLPKSGIALSEIKTALEASLQDDVHAHFSRAFRGPKDVQDVGSMAYNMFLSDNGLFSLRSGYMQRIETEVIEMCVSLFNPPEGASGTFTSGGSESIYSALHAMREWAKEKFPRITEPEVIAPYSAHPSFSKGCHYYGLKLVRTALGDDLRASLKAMEAAISPNTIGLVGSAPCWPYGLYDPIGEIGALAAKHGVWMHVDACVGGYLAPFAEKLGYKLPVWDFRVPGVMSISADLHKFGYCPKPASTILWRSGDLMKYHHVHPADWPGGQYNMTGMAGSRSAGPIFAAWAVLRYLGVEGYVRLARKTMDNKARLEAGISAIDGLFVLKNDLLPLAFGATELDLGIIKGEMSNRGWIIVGCAEPPLINLPLDAALDDIVINTFLSDLAEVTSRTRERGCGRKEGLVY